MPSEKDPSQIKVGAGRAGQGSVTASSLTFTPGQGSSLDPVIEAKDVRSEEPPFLAGDNVQANLNVINGLAPAPRPNRLGETANPLNLATLSYNPVPVLARFPDGTATGTLAQVVETSTLEISGVLYPADRGILAVKLDGVVVQAINLSNVFTEGGPDDVTVPSRVQGQNDLLAPGPVAAVDGLPVDIALVDRLPQLTSYVRANFAFLGAGPDPVYDVYPEPYAGFQLARFVISLDLGAGSGSAGVLSLVHYRTEDDYFQDKIAAPFESYAIITPFTEPVYRDSDALSSVVVNSFSFVANDTDDTVEVTPRTLSGVTYYAPSDTFNVSFDADGVYEDTFLTEGVRYRFHPGSDVVSMPLDYAQYSPNPILTGSSSTFSDAAEVLVTDERCVIADMELAAQDPFGREDTGAGPATLYLIHGATTYQQPSDTPPPSRLLVENFIDESVRHPSLVETAVNPAATASAWDSAAPLLSDALEVRGLSPDHVVPEGVAGLGGELVYPQTDYSTGFQPALPGGVAQPDYSGLTGDRSFIRAFGLSKPTDRLQVRLVGNPTTGNTLYEDLYNPTLELFSASGVVVAFVFGNKLVSLGRPKAFGGALVNATSESTYSVLFDVNLGFFPLFYDPSSLYSLQCVVRIEDGSAAATGGDFALYKIEIIEST
jgi:hypothetical protein